jgi:hypothetical protein
MDAPPARRRSLSDSTILLAALLAALVTFAARAQVKTPSTTRPTTRATATTIPTKIDPDLVGWWRADRAGPDGLIDLTGKGHVARPMASAGKIAVEQVDGRAGVRFTRDGQGLSAGSDPAFDFTADFTVALRVKLAADTGDVTLLSKADRGGAAGWAIVHGIRGIGGIGFVAAPGVFVPTPLKATDGWSHVAVTFHDRDFLLYVDGKQIGIRELEVVPPPAKAALTFGASPQGGGRMDGWLDDVRIYHRALTPAEMEALAAGREPKNPYGKLAPAEEKSVRGLIRQLGADDFAKREAAGASLKQMGRRIFPILKEYRDSDDLEVASRVRDLLGDLPTGGGDEGTQRK